MKNLFLLLLLSVMPVMAQTNSVPLIFQTLTNEQGLPHNYVHSITQDHNGFLWIGTNYGLARYDGYQFKVFQPNPKKKYSITHKPVGKLFVDSKDRLWITINSGGINKMDLETERFTGYFYDSTGKNHISIVLRNFYEDADSVIWLASDAGVFKYDEGKDCFIDALVNRDKSHTNIFVNSMTDDLCGNLWILSNHQLYILEKQSLKLKPFKDFSSLPITQNLVVRNIFSNEKGKIWIATEHNGLLCYNIINQNIEAFLEKTPFIGDVYIDKRGTIFAVTNNPVYKLFVCRKEQVELKQFEEFPFSDSKLMNRNMKFVEDNFDNLWIASPVGTGCYNLKTGFTNYVNNTRVANNLSFEHIEDIFTDRTDNLWMIPYRKGIYKADLRQKPFKTYTFALDEHENNATQKNVSSILCDSKGLLWLSESDSTITCYDRKKDKYWNFVLNTADAVTSIHEDIDGYMWLGTYWGNLLRVKTPDISKIPNRTSIKLSKAEIYNLQGVRRITSDSSHNVWFASATGLVEWNRSTKTFVNHSLLYDSLNSISSFYRTVFIDKGQVIWTGSNNGGLCRYDKKSHTFKHYLQEPNNPQSISNNTVYAIYEEEGEHLLVGTAQGLLKFNRKDETFQKVLKEEDLAERSVFSIFPDTMGSYWMSSDKGIIRYNTKSMTGTIYGRSDGLQKNEFTTTASFMSPDGEIFFGGTGGLVSFIPSEIKSNPVQAKPVITNFMFYNKVISPGDSLNGRILLDKQIWKTKRIVLNYSENDFSLEFSALLYAAPEKIKYEYRLAGFHDQWISVDASRRWANFTGLPPGKYLFEMRATNNDGVMCDAADEVKLTIEITPPFWRTNWFRVLVIIILAIMITAMYKLRVKHLQAQKKQLARMVAEQTCELAESNVLLKERQEEIITQNEELAEANALLEESQEEVQNQNEELMFHRHHLEKLVTDKTLDLENALKKAEEADRLKTAFLANLSHEIRTPMNAIIGFSNLLCSVDNEEERVEFIKTINNNCDSLLVLINDILDISMIESNQVTINKSPFNLVPVMQEIEALFKLRNTGSIEITYENPDSEFWIYSDSFRLRQILNNLIANAVKFTDEGSVRFGFKVDGDYVEFYVNDTGVGIESMDFEKIFDHFHKKEVIEGRIYRGTGIGLSICKNMVQLLGGVIWVNAQVGKGSSFRFTIPSKN